MLVMRRKRGEAIHIGDNVEVRILSIHGAHVKIGIMAPREVPVVARELELVCAANRAAAASPLPDGLAAMAEALRKAGKA